jgi:hypothetical protein
MLPGTLTSALGRFPSVVRVKPSGFLSAIHYPYFLHSAFWYYDLSNIISNVEKGSVFYLSHKKLVIFFYPASYQYTSTTYSFQEYFFSCSLSAQYEMYGTSISHGQVFTRCETPSATETPSTLESETLM